MPLKKGERKTEEPNSSSGGCSISSHRAVSGIISLQVFRRICEVYKKQFLFSFSSMMMHFMHSLSDKLWGTAKAQRIIQLEQVGS